MEVASDDLRGLASHHSTHPPLTPSPSHSLFLFLFFFSSVAAVTHPLRYTEGLYVRVCVRNRNTFFALRRCSVAGRPCILRLRVLIEAAFDYLQYASHKIKRKRQHTHACASQEEERTDTEGGIKHNEHAHYRKIVQWKSHTLSETGLGGFLVVCTCVCVCVCV